MPGSAAYPGSTWRAIGKVYIIARTPKDAVNVHIDDDVLRDWHPGIGQALIENWKLPEKIATAVGG